MLISTFETPKKQARNDPNLKLRIELEVLIKVQPFNNEAIVLQSFIQNFGNSKN